MRQIRIIEEALFRLLRSEGLLHKIAHKIEDLANFAKDLILRHPSTHAR